MLYTKVCEDVLYTEPENLLVFALLGNGSDQIELGSNVYNICWLYTKSNDKIQAYGVLPQFHGHPTPRLPSKTPMLQ